MSKRGTTLNPFHRPVTLGFTYVNELFIQLVMALLDVEKDELYNISPELGDRCSTKDVPCIM
jgi:hypothetical protein